MTKHKPGQPLPWRLVSNNYGGKMIVAADNDGKNTKHRRVLRCAQAPIRAKDAAYILHTANTYPKMADTLRDLYITFSKPWCSGEHAAREETLKKARVLLLNLGELS